MGGVRAQRTGPTGEAADAKDKTELWMLKSHQHQEEAEYQLTGSLSDQMRIWLPGFLNTNGVVLTDCEQVALFNQILSLSVCVFTASEEKNEVQVQIRYHKLDARL